MGDKVWVQCECGKLHQVESEYVWISDDGLYTEPIYCYRCRDECKHLLIGKHKEDVYWIGNSVLDERYYIYNSK